MLLYCYYYCIVIALLLYRNCIFIILLFYRYCIVIVSLSYCYCVVIVFVIVFVIVLLLCCYCVIIFAAIVLLLCCHCIVIVLLSCYCCCIVIVLSCYCIIIIIIIIIIVTVIAIVIYIMQLEKISALFNIGVKIPTLTKSSNIISSKTKWSAPYFFYPHGLEAFSEVFGCDKNVYSSLLWEKWLALQNETVSNRKYLYCTIVRARR